MSTFGKAYKCTVFARFRSIYKMKNALCFVKDLSGCHFSSSDLHFK